MKPFEGLLGNTSELRMIEYLLPLEGVEFNLTELAEEVDLSRPSATRAVKKFVEWGLINSKRKGSSIYYSINLESPIIKNILQLNNLLIEKILGEETLYEIGDYLERKKSLGETNAANILMNMNLKPSNCVNTYLYKTSKERVLWQEHSPYDHPSIPEVSCCNESKSIYLSGATT